MNIYATLATDDGRTLQGWWLVNRGRIKKDPPLVFTIDSTASCIMGWVHIPSETKASELGNKWWREREKDLEQTALSLKGMENPPKRRDDDASCRQKKTRVEKGLGMFSFGEDGRFPFVSSA